MEKYRIKEVNGKFIPQIRIWEVFFYDWYGIDNNFYKWISEEHQYTYCGKDTLEEAKEIIQKYKPKYHKL